MLALLFTEITPSTTTSDEDVNLWETLQEYSDTLGNLNYVSSLLVSQEYRSNLIQLAAALNISDESRVRKALQEDEAELAEILHEISASAVDKQAVLQLEDDDAQKFLDVVQSILDRGFLLNHEDCARARRLLVRLSETCDKLPSTLFIKGVCEPDTQASYGGGFGDVYRASYKGRVVALKRMRLFGRDSPSMRRRFCREALLWQHLRSPYIVPFLGIDADTFPSQLCLVSPWHANGTVLKHLADNGRTHLNKRLYEIAQGLQYLHSRNIVHGDLRGSNILINDRWEACLTDFGLTVFNDATVAVTGTSSRREGSVRWCAPELFVPETFGLGRHRLTSETDIYAFACVVVELVQSQSRTAFGRLSSLPGATISPIA
ncbi:kinase-like domain-containing protein [Mycena floridula]|nr:kinase-like domain-containing protein [Mycena floridula]